MLDQKTLFVIGAGAGQEINMPVGSDLTNTIAAKANIKYEDFGTKLKSGDLAVSYALRRITKKRDIDFNAWRAEVASIAEGIHYTKSIDAYLSTHKDNEAVKVGAKLAIVQSILEAERDCHVYWDRDHWKSADGVRLSWFPAFFHILQDGVDAKGDLSRLFKNLSVISFNYDRCLEHYLFHAMQHLFRVQEGDAAAAIGHLKIFHPYGQVGLLPWDVKSGRKVGFGVNDYGDIEGLAEEIRTFNEQIEEGDRLVEIRKQVADAERIVFLGFHFHKQNMELLRTEISSAYPRIIYGTVVKRSGAEIKMIKERVLTMCANNHPGEFELLGLGCNVLFEHYGTTWM
jgi:hypothetical protein